MDSELLVNKNVNDPYYFGLTIMALNRFDINISTISVRLPYRILNKKSSISCPHPYKQTFMWRSGRFPPEPYPPYEEAYFSISK